MSFRGDGMKNNPYQNIIDEMTVEECIQGIERLDICCNRAEIVREKATQLLEKHIPKKPSEVESDYFVCPRCGTFITALDEFSTHKYCLNCGQALDWGAGENNGK